MYLDMTIYIYIYIYIYYMKDTNTSDFTLYLGIFHIKVYYCTFRS